MRKIAIILFLAISGYVGAQQNNLDISGKWAVKLDPKDNGIQQQWFKASFDDEITLPGSLTEAGYGEKTSGSDYGILTPTYKYIGPAWYQKEITIPALWKEKEIILTLERVLWESRVYIDNELLSIADALGTAHVHKLGKLKPGKHVLNIRVNNDMIHNIGDKGHAYGEYTQSIWNGIVGKMELHAKDPVHFKHIKVSPDIDKDQLHLKLEFPSGNKNPIQLSFEINELKTGNKVWEKSNIKIDGNNKVSEITLDLKQSLKKWTEFNPVVYILKGKLVSGNFKDEIETEFGFRKVSHDGTKVLINDKPVFLRGNLDCVHFPLTGYPSCKAEDWEKIFQTYKDYGLNHVRYHSWCPPEAAFKAADRLGIYIQAEASIWIDWWMSIDMIKRGRPEMDTKGHPKGLGYDAVRDSFVVEEMNRVVDFYGNHPSFIMFCIGNELGNSDFDVMKKWVADLKVKDPHRLYAVSTARTITEVDDYCATHYIQGVGRTRGLNGSHTNWDFEKVYSQMDIPIIAHEIGQWPVYPKWSEINKYKGVLKARNFEEFRAIAQKNGVVDQDVDFARASGALNQIMYKYEVESFLRTASCAGVQLLSIQDYQGQGEALIGWLDSHWESKDISSPKKFREHYTTTVPLLRMDKFIWTNDETFEASAQLSHHGDEDISGIVKYTIQDEKGNVLLQNNFENKSFAIGTLSDLGNISFPLRGISEAKKLSIHLQVKDTEFKNSWDIWVYPEVLPEPKKEKVLIASTLNESTLNALKKGKKVLLVANELGDEGSSVSAHFYPLYWSLTFFPGQGKTNIGLLLQENHPAFDHFPSNYHSDWQWESICTNAKAFELNKLSKEYKPIAQPVDDFHRNNKMGSIFELKVGEGKLLVCGYNILNEKLPVARQLKHSLLKYMESESFDPQQTMDEERLAKLLIKIEKAEPAMVPKKFTNAILYINAASQLKQLGKNVAWEKELDDVVVAKQTKYTVKGDGVWKDKRGSSWLGNEMEITMECPEGMLGTLYLHFDDWDKKNRTGLLEFEGRKLKLGKHDGGQWVKFHVMREDSNDGKLILKTKSLTGSNLMITKLVLTKE